MIHKQKTQFVFILAVSVVFFIVFALTGCGSGGSGSGSGRGSTDDFPVPEASGEAAYSGGGATLDASNANEGYVMVKYEGSASKAKVQITGTDGNVYTYTLTGSDYKTFPLTTGSGSYDIKIYENAGGDMYNLCISQNISADISDEFSPFLIPNQYVWFTKGMKTMDLAMDLSEHSSNDLEFVDNVYNYVTENIEYDNAKAADAPVDYVPVIDETIDTGKGICFDYASVMSAMLRSQGVPSKLVVGYSGSTYHAWISVYTDETGWVDDIIEFDGKSWSLMDPTLASANGDEAVKEYIGDGNNYVVKYNY